MGLPAMVIIETEMLPSAATASGMETCGGGARGGGGSTTLGLVFGAWLCFSCDTSADRELKEREHLEQRYSLIESAARDDSPRSDLNVRTSEKSGV